MENVQYKTRVLIFMEGIPQKTIPNIFSCEVKSKKLSHTSFTYTVSSVNCIESNKTDIDQRPAHYLGN